MKILRFPLFAVLLGSTAFAQTNTFPSSGNVGIGTDTPSVKLDLVGNQHIQYGYYLRFPYGGELNQDDAKIAVGMHAQGLNIVGSKTDGTFRKIAIWGEITQEQNDGTNRWRGNNYFSGHVGIGTSNPQSSLDVRGSIIAATGDFTNGSIGSFLQIQHGAASGNTYTDIGAFSAGGTAWNNLVLQRGGKVGIGTTTPEAKLTIKDGSHQLHLYYNESDNLRLYRDDSIGVLQAQTDGAGYDPIALNPYGGNVGIGTTNPQHKLAVNGTIKAKEVIVETTGWSDYVLADDYALQPLAEVEAHIKTNKHLPGIPSAAQVAEQGVSVGDMQARLLAKIEELTLHQIAQEKELAALRTEVRALRDNQR
jgi:hypothetical protein